MDGDFETQVQTLYQRLAELTQQARDGMESAAARQALDDLICSVGDVEESGVTIGRDADRLRRAEEALRAAVEHAQQRQAVAEEARSACAAMMERTRESEERLRLATAAAGLGVWDWDIPSGALRWSDHCKVLLGVSTHSQPDYRQFLDMVHPDDRAAVLDAIQTSLRRGTDYECEFRVLWPDRTVHWLLARGRPAGPDGQPDRMLGVVLDISQRKADSEALRAALVDLERSNRELEEFAYVASHDLQEPLRMVASHLQLLEARCGRRLGADAGEYIDFAVEGAKRMQALITDLLAYSRVGRGASTFGPADCDAALDKALANLRQRLRETGAQVTRSPLPTVYGDETQFVQLFQNLLGNALKFRGDRPAHIDVSAQRQARQWTFCVRDNGIGIDPRHAERIFQIFQRLHSREKFEGTGVGLAICRKIVQRHGGRIWVRSTAGGGASFFFSLPADEHARQESHVHHSLHHH